MMSRLFGKTDSTIFSMEWLPLIYVAVNATIINWSQILSANLEMAIREYRRKRSVSSRIFPPFFMSAYLMDVVCFCSQFPNMGWKWTIQNPLPIHVYHKILWESKFNPHFYKIYQGIMLPIHKTIFDRMAPRFFEEAKIDILLVVRWFNDKTFTYIKVFGSIVSSRFLPYYVPDKLLGREITYQTVGFGQFN